MRQLAAAVILCATAATARAQAPGNASLSFEALAKAPLGSWATYGMSTQDKHTISVRYALVAKSADAISIEIATTVPHLVMRMDFTANGPAAWRLSKMRMRMGDGEPQEAPVPEGAEQIIKKGGSFGRLVGKETIKTRIGAFVCNHYKQVTPQGASEVWMSDQVLPAGLVQHTVPGMGAKITLEAVGSGATAAIP